MATRTLLIGVSFVSGAGRAAALSGDQFIEPGDVGFGGMHPALHQSKSIPVQAASAPSAEEGAAGGAESFYQCRPAALENPDPPIGPEVAEERETELEAAFVLLGMATTATIPG